MEKSSKHQLRLLITTYFNDSELRTLCFDLGIDYENLGGDNKEAKTRELIAYCQRHARVSILLDFCQELRPSVKWPTWQEFTLISSRTNQSPLPTPYFVKRRTVLSRIKSELFHQNTGTKMCKLALFGLAGSGKTTLAQHLAHDPEVSMLFPDGILWLDSGRSSPFTLLSDVLYTYGTQPSPVLEQIIKQVRSITNEKKILVIIDNVEKLDDVRLISSALDSGQLIITTRSRDIANSISDRTPLRIEGFANDEEVTELFRNIINVKFIENNRLTISTLAKWCDYHPLALEIVAKVIRINLKKPHWKLEDFLSILSSWVPQASYDTDAASIYSLIDSLVNEVLEQINDFDAQNIFVNLGTFAHGEFSISAAGVVCQLDEERMVKALEKAINYSLVQWGQSRGRYKMHPLVQSCAGKMLHEGRFGTSAEATHKNMYHYYVQELNQGVDNTFIKADFENILKALTAIPNNTVLVSESDALLFTNAVLNLVNYLHFRGYYEDAIKIVNDAIKTCEKQKLFTKLSHLYYHAGFIQMSRGDYKKSKSNLEISAHYARQDKDESAQATILSQLATVYINLGNYAEGEKLYHESLKLVNNNSLIGCLIMHYIGTAKVKRMFYAEALYWLSKSEQSLYSVDTDDAYMSIDKERVLISIYAFTSLAYLGLGLFKIARGFCKEAIRLSELIIEKNWLANLGLITSTLELIKGDVTVANRVSLDSLKHFQDVGNQQGELAALSRLASPSFFAKNYNNARAYLNESLKRSRELNYSDWEALNLFYLGLVSMLENRPDLTEFFFEKSKEIYISIGHTKALEIIDKYIKEQDFVEAVANKPILELSGITLF